MGVQEIMISDTYLEIVPLPFSISAAVEASPPDFYPNLIISLPRCVRYVKVEDSQNGDLRDSLLVERILGTLLELLEEEFLMELSCQILQFPARQTRRTVY